MQNATDARGTWPLPRIAVRTPCEQVAESLGHATDSPDLYIADEICADDLASVYSIEYDPWRRRGLDDGEAD